MSFTNVLVLGTNGVKTAQFCKFFKMYLTCNDFEQSRNLAMNDASKCFTINNLRLIYEEDSYISHQIISLLSNFQEQKSLSTIIILKRKEKDISKLKRFVFEEFKPKMLYIYVHDTKSYKNYLKRQRGNEFHFNEDTFYDASNNNWCDAVNFYKNIHRRIAGDETLTTGIRTKISNELLLNLIDNLFELLIPICICATAECQIIEITEYKKNVTYRYTNQYIERIKAEYSNKKDALYVKIKTPKVNSNNYFKFTHGDALKYKNNASEAEAAINIVATFYLYKKQNQLFNSEDIFSNFLDIEGTGAIFGNFIKRLIQKVKELKKKSEPITKGDVVMCLKNLYGFDAKIIPRFIEEIFPDNICCLQLPGKQTKSGQHNLYEFCLQTEPAKIYEDKFEMQTVKRKVRKLKRTMQRIMFKFVK